MSSHSLAADDDLGFDPFLESNKGLADMMENENIHGAMNGGHQQHMAPPQPLPGIVASSVVSSIVAMPIVTSSSSSLPPPPPGLSGFPLFSHGPTNSHAPGTIFPPLSWVTDDQSRAAPRSSWFLRSIRASMCPIPGTIYPGQSTRLVMSSVESPRSGLTVVTALCLR